MPLFEVVAPAHAAMGNASIEVMVHCLKAQTLSDWALTVVSDGPEERIREIVERHSDGRIRYLATERAFGDHGHSPRELGLRESTGDWVILSGIDNYYVPLFFAEVAKKIEDDVGLLYVDFLLDMKGEAEMGEAFDIAMAAYSPSTTKDPEVVTITPVFDGKIEELTFRRDDDLQTVAADFLQRKQLQGGGCDDSTCVRDLLIDAMRAAAEQREVRIERPRALPPYSGHIDALIDTPGHIDIGAVAMRADIAKHIGFRWRHHAADFDYLQAASDYLRQLKLRSVKIPQTLYVHN